MERIIWTLWWQGEEMAPPIVKSCIASMRKHSNGAKVIVLSQTNLNEYINLSENISMRLKQKKISYTHLSDIIRMQLLSIYGGLWLDSTVYVLKDIPIDIFEHEYFTIPCPDAKCISQGRWSGYISGGKKNCIIFNEMNSLFEKYWSTNDELICYLLIDFFMKKVYDSNYEAQKLIDSVEKRDTSVYKLVNDLNKEYRENVFLQYDLFQKLSWKSQYQLQVNGKMTIYGHILQETNVTVVPEVQSKEYIILKKMKSFLGHVKTNFSIKHIKKYGFKIAFWSFMNSCVRTLNNDFAIKIAHKYNLVIYEFLNTLV